MIQEIPDSQHDHVQTELNGWLKAITEQVPSRKVAKRPKVVERREKRAKIYTVPDEKQEVVVKKTRKNSKSIASEYKELPSQLPIPFTSTHISEILPSTIKHNLQIQHPSSIAPASPRHEHTTVCELLDTEQQYYQLQQLRIEQLPQ